MRFFLSLAEGLMEAGMLFKIKVVRSDLRKLPGRTRFLIILNLNKLLACVSQGRASIQEIVTFKAGMLLKTNEA
jgi:hypothetical protein